MKQDLFRIVKVNITVVKNQVFHEILFVEAC